VAGESATRLAVSVSDTLSKHRAASFLITAVIVLLVADAIRRVLPDDTRVSALTWILAALMAYAVVATMMVRRRTPADMRAFFAMALGLSPAFFGFAGALAGSPQALMWGGVLLSLCLVGVALATTTPRHESEL
jgi:hypothetical protein